MIGREDCILKRDLDVIRVVAERLVHHDLAELQKVELRVLRTPQPASHGSDNVEVCRGADGRLVVEDHDEAALRHGGLADSALDGATKFAKAHD